MPPPCWTSSSCGPGLTGSAILSPAGTDTEATSNSSKGGEKTLTPSAFDVPASTSGLPCVQTVSILAFSFFTTGLRLQLPYY